MKMKHIVKLTSGELEVYVFRTKEESDKAIVNAVQLHKTFGAIKCIWVEPMNHPEKRQRIDFLKEEK
jgi:hypothetical protein